MTSVYGPCDRITRLLLALDRQEPTAAQVHELRTLGWWDRPLTRLEAAGLLAELGSPWR